MHKNKKMKRMMDGGMADMRRPGTMVQPGVPSGPKIGVRPADGKPANPRVTYGPRTPGPKGPMVQPGVPSVPTVAQPLPRIGYGPNDGGPRPMGPRITPVDVTGMPVGGPKTGVMPTRRAMRGGGLARKGVGMALAKGGLARRAGGCAKRGVGRGKIM